MEIHDLCLAYPVVVEGKYDKIRLSSFVTSPIIVLGGFSAFKSREKLDELRAFARSGGLILLTDSDSAGTFIRGRLKGLLPDCKLINIYTPVIRGTDNRRNHACREGLLGVESIDNDILYKLLAPLAVETATIPFLSRVRAYNDGLCGRQNSSELRKLVCERYGLPPSVSAEALIEYINGFSNEAEYTAIIESLQGRS